MASPGDGQPPWRYRLPNQPPSVIDLTGMDKKDTEFSKDLSEYRKQIDALDDKIIALLLERIGIVNKVGEMKRRAHPGQCPIRSAREAEVVRRVMQKFEDSLLTPAAAGAMWRTLIGASTAIEGALTLSVYSGDGNDLYWLAREYFGLFIPSVKHPHVKRVIGDVIDGKASVGIVPMLRSSDTGFWWTNLTGRGDHGPKIFAVLPYIYHGTPGRDAPSCLAIANIQPEETGDDRSLFSIEADHTVSQNKLQSALSAAGMGATWVSIATLSPQSRHHLVEIRGFVGSHHPALGKFEQAMGSSLAKVSFLGAYAAPIILDAKHPHAELSMHAHKS